MQQNFEVIRFVGQNGRFHIVMDCVEGELLSAYLQKEESMSKKTFLCMISNLAKEIEGLEKSNATEYFPYLTPFHIVLKEDNSVAFLKYSEKYNKKIEKVLEYFLPADGTENYYYSYGRVIQFILSKIRLRPRLTKLEEFKIRRIISKCMVIKPKKQFHNAKEILVRLSAVKKSKRAFAVMSVVFGVGIIGSFLKVNIILPESQKIDSYQQLQAYMAGETTWSEAEVEQALKVYEAENENDFDLAEREWIMRVCYQLNTGYSRQQMKKHGEILFRELVSKRELLANIQVEDGDLEQAIKEYEILIVESPTAERYSALAALLEKGGRDSEALHVCEAGCQLFSNRVELQLQYVKYLFGDESISAQEKNEHLESFLEHYPLLRDNEAFVQLKQELGIQGESNHE